VRRPAVLCAGALTSALLLSACDYWANEPVSGTVTGTATGDGASQDAVFSPDGGTIAFVSLASNLGPTDTNRRNDVYLRDVPTGETRLVSTNAAGTDSGNDHSSDPVFSPDGTKLAFLSRATNLGPADSNPDYDVYLYDLASENTTLVSAGTDGRAAGGGAPAFSPDGARIAFYSGGATFGPTDNNNTFDIYLRDLASGAATLISVNAAGTDGGNSQSVNPVFSPDGTKIAFQSQASDLDPEVFNFLIGSDVFYRDLVGEFTVTVSTDATRTQDAGGDSFGAVWSPDSRKLLFWSAAGNLGPPDDSTRIDLYLRDVRTSAIWRLPVDSPEDLSMLPEGQIPGTWADPEFSADGTKIVFVSWNNDLAPGDFRPGADAYIYTLADRSFRLVTVPSPTTGGDGWTYAPSFNADATKVVYVTTSTNAVPNDRNGSAPDVVVTELDGLAETRVSHARNPIGDSADGPSYDATFSPTADVVVFTSEAANVVPFDTNQQSDVFVGTLVEDDD
jgi:Tol biopolymer transport system component